MRRLRTTLGVAALGGGILVAVLAGTGGRQDGGALRGGFAGASPRAATSSLSMDVREIARRRAAGVVGVRAQVLRSDPRRGLMVASADGAGVLEGSGFVVDEDGLILTSAHLVDGAIQIEVVLDDGRTVPATPIGSDDDTDCALVRIDADGHRLEPLELGDSAAAARGDQVVTLAGTGAGDVTIATTTLAAGTKEVTTASGAMEAVLRAPAGAGQRRLGAPLMDATGRVLGLHVRLPGTGGDDGSAPSVVLPAATIARILPQLETAGRVERAYLGVLLDVAADPAVEDGVPVRAVADGSPAAGAGVRGALATAPGAPGDAIERLDGTEVDSAREVVDVLARHAPGDVVSLVLRTGEARRTLQVRLADRPAALWSSTPDDGAPGL